MNRTDRAEAALEAYLAQVRSALSGLEHIDVEEVLSGIVEHLDTDLHHKDGDPPVTELTMAQALERLGSPTEWAAQLGAPAQEARVLPGDGDPHSWRPSLAVAALGLGTLGGVLELAGWASPVGWLLIGVGALTARVATGEGTKAGGPSGLLSLTRGYWTLASLAVGALILVLPGGLAWGQGQIGGALADLTAEGGLWGLVSMSTGMWWILIGGIARSRLDFVEALIGPAAFRPSSAFFRMLTRAGVLLTAAGVAGWLLR